MSKNKFIKCIGMLKGLCVGGLISMVVVPVWAISESKCRTNDWFAVGRDYGFKGQPEDKVLNDQNACQKKGVEIPIADYKKGWQTGIAQYCGADNAYKLGFQKKSAAKHCPLEMKANFEQFFKWGKEAAEVQQEIKRSDKKLKNRKQDLAKAERKVDQLRNEVKKLSAENEQLREKVAGIEKSMSEKRLEPQPKPVGL